MIKTSLTGTERSKKSRLMTGLAPDVQANIERISDNFEELKTRCMAAQRYAELFPPRLSSGADGVSKRSLARPGDTDYHAHTGPDEYCVGCGGVLTRLEQPRQYPGMCLPCVMGTIQ